MSASPIGARHGVPLIVAVPFRGLAGKSDKRLVELAQRGDTHAIEVLYDRYATAILRYCRSLLRSTQEAEDVQQEVFVTALSALRNGAGPESFRPWLYRVAHNACISHMRAKRPTLVAVDGELVASATTEPASEEREELRQLLDDLSALPEVQRGALLLREMDGFSYEQVGQVLGLPVTTVRSTIFRARSTLQGLAEARDANCADIQAELSELADRRGRRSRRITSHLHVCADCRDFRAGLRCRPAVLSGYVPALPIGLLASVKASVLGAHGAAGGAGAAVAGGTSGFGVLSGAGGGKLVAVAASACALIGGAGTQVGVIGGDGAARDDTTVVVAEAGGSRGDGSKAPRRSAPAPGGQIATTTAHRYASPAAYQNAISHHAPGTVVWRPANGDDAVVVRHTQAVAQARVIAATSGSRYAGSPTNMQWGYAQPGVAGQYGGAGEPDDQGTDADDDRPDTDSRRGDRRRSQSAGSDSRTSSATTSFSGSSTGAQDPDDDDRTASSQQPAPEPEPEPAREDQRTADSTPAQQPASDPAPDSPPKDPAPDSSATSTAPASSASQPTDPAPGSPPTDTAAGGAAPDPTAGGAATTSDPAQPPGPAPSTP